MLTCIVAYFFVWRLEIRLEKAPALIMSQVRHPLEVVLPHGISHSERNENASCIGTSIDVTFHPGHLFNYELLAHCGQPTSEA